MLSQSNPTSTTKPTVQSLEAMLLSQPVSGSKATDLGSFAIGPQLGQGGNATVYRATHRATGETVALKRLRLDDEPALQCEAEARFHREVRALNAIQHPNVCRLVGYSDHAADGFLALEYLEGMDLATLTQRTGALPSQAVVLIAEQLAAALEAVHAAGVVHRDLKPGNVMLTKDGVVKLIDFGIARFDDEATAVTERGIVVGTPAYMAPEHVQGGEVSPAFDAFSFGVTLYDLLVGHHPWARLTPREAAVQAARGALPPVFEQEPTVTAPVEEIVTALMHRVPEQRATLRQVRAALAPLTAVVHRRRPTLLQDLARDPEATVASCRASMAAIHVAQAESLAAANATGNTAAVALALYRAHRYQPDNAEIGARFAHACAHGGYDFNRPIDELGTHLTRQALASTAPLRALVAVAEHHQRRGDLFRACAWYRRALHMSPADQQVRAALDALEVGAEPETTMPREQSLERVRRLLVGLQHGSWASATYAEKTEALRLLRPEHLRQPSAPPVTAPVPRVSPPVVRGTRSREPRVSVWGFAARVAVAVTVMGIAGGVLTNQAMTTSYALAVAPAHASP